MDRDEFMELVYETFADEPDNVLANGIIEAADAYVEHEKAQLFSEDATKDTISRQAAIDAANDWYEGLICGSINGLIKRLNALPTAQPEPHWIPVERELPEDFTDVLVWFEYFRYGDYNCLYQTHGIGTYVANYNLWTVNHETGWKDLRVIAWMPLPEAYKPNK